MRPLREDAEAVSEPCQKYVRREDCDTRGSQLDTERQAVHPLTDGDDGRGVGLCELKVMFDSARSFHEKGNSRKERCIVGPVDAGQHRNHKWRNIENLLCSRSEPGAAGRNHLHQTAARKNLPNQACDAV